MINFPSRFQRRNKRENTLLPWRRHSFYKYTMLPPYMHVHQCIWLRNVLSILIFSIVHNLCLPPVKLWCLFVHPSGNSFHNLPSCFTFYPVKFLMLIILPCFQDPKTTQISNILLLVTFWKSQTLEVHDLCYVHC